MGRLVLVRHGQACAFTDDPDRLSETGWEQCQILGRYWKSHGIRFDLAFHGSLRRQRESYQAAAQGYGADGADFPAATELPGLNEYEAQDVIAEVAPRLAATDLSFAPLWQAWLDGRDGADRNRPFQRMFEAVMERWVEGKMQEPGLVPWQQFRERVETTLARLRATPGRGLHLVAFTSGGPIGVALQSCLGAPARAALDINWRVRNSSLTSFLYQGSRFSVDAFNETPHLASFPDLVTFR